MDEEQFQDFIAKRRVVVVHFSHLAVMKHEVPFPEDLHHALNNWRTERRSCCALWPGHGMNLPGTVGVIFRPELSNVLSVLASDSGASDESGEESSLGQLPSETTLTESLEVPPGSYNEWRLTSAKPLGIFVTNIDHILVKQLLKVDVPEEAAKLMDENQLGWESLEFSMVEKAFTDQDIYTMGDEGIEFVCKRGGV